MTADPLLVFWLLAGVLGVAVTLWVLRPAAAARRVAGGQRGRNGRWPLALVALGVPLAAVLGYATLGAPRALVAGVAEVPHRPGQGDVEAMVGKLQARLRAEPQDLAGWFVLARSLQVLERWGESAEAWRRALRLAPQDADVLADAADAIATAQGGSLEGEPALLVARALQAQPEHPKALALAATAAQRLGRRAEAASLWQRLLVQLPPDSAAAQRVRESLAQAQAPAK